MPRMVGDAMTPEVTTVAPEATLVEVARLMRDRDIGDVLVVDRERLTGLLTDRDVVVRGVADGGEPARLRAADVCSGNVVTLSPFDTTADAIRLMRRHTVRRLPVVDDGKPVGIVSIGDLAEQQDRGSALADISKAEGND